MSTDTTTVAQLWAEARDRNLEGVIYCCVYCIEEMAAAFNGCGPEWMPANLRALLDKIFSDFAPCFLIHDIEWEYCDGTERFFHHSNGELRDNCLAMADALHPWWSPLRYLRRHQARLIYRACEDFGRSAYNQAYIDQTIKAKAGK